MKLKHLTLGATGRFPFGKASADDEGELSLAVAADHRQGIIRIAFGSPVTWIGFPSSHARELAAAILEKADELDKRKA